MAAFALTLRLFAPIIFMVAAIHLALGTSGEVILGAKLPAGVPIDPVLDSQDRFYGVAFAIYGVLLWHCANDIVKYQSVLRCMLWVFFAAGCARFVALLVTGMPALPVMPFWALELIVPPILLAWLARLMRAKR